LPLSGSSGT